METRAETFLALILGCVGCCREARVAKREKRAVERLERAHSVAQ